MEFLSKENFWRPLQETFPVHMKQFQDWIDGYKKRISWEFYFAEGIKFHDLPLEMQTGIVFLFFREAWEIDNDIFLEQNVGQTIKDVFAEKFMTDTTHEMQKD